MQLNIDPPPALASREVRRGILRLMDLDAEQGLDRLESQSQGAVRDEDIDSEPRHVRFRDEGLLHSASTKAPGMPKSPPIGCRMRLS